MSGASSKEVQLKHPKIRQYCDHYVQGRFYVTETSFFSFQHNPEVLLRGKKKDSHSVFQAPYCSHLRIPHGRIQQRAQTVLKLCIKCNTASRVERVIGGHHYIHLIVVLAASAWVTHVKKIDVTDKQSMYELSTKGFSMNELKNSEVGWPAELCFSTHTTASTQPVMAFPFYLWKRVQLRILLLVKSEL